MPQDMDAPHKFDFQKTVVKKITDHIFECAPAIVYRELEMKHCRGFEDSRTNSIHAAIFCPPHPM